MPLKVVLILANSADPDEMQAAFHLGLHCLHINQTTLRQHFIQFLPHQFYHINIELMKFLTLHDDRTKFDQTETDR